MDYEAVAQKAAQDIHGSFQTAVQECLGQFAQTLGAELYEFPEAGGQLVGEGDLRPLQGALE